MHCRHTDRNPCPADNARANFQRSAYELRAIAHGTHTQSRAFQDIAMRNSAPVIQYFHLHPIA